MGRFWVITCVAMLVVGIATFLAFRAEPPAPSEIPTRPASPAPSPASPSTATPLPRDSGPVARAGDATAPSCETDEEFLNYRRGQARQSIPVVYEDVGAQLNLTTDENSRLLSLLIEQSAQRKMPLTLLCGDEATARRFRDQMAARHRAEIVDVLGTRRMPAFDQYEITVDARIELQFMASHLNQSHLALSEDQRKRLLGIFLRADALPPPRERVPGQPADSYRQELETWMDQNDQRLLDGARQVLGAEQLASYSRVLDDRRDNYITAEMIAAGFETADPD